MPGTWLPIRAKLQIPISSPALALLLISATLGGCSGGDFGRTRQDFLNDDMHRWIGGGDGKRRPACLAIPADR